jgi:phage tail-like protein
MSLILANRNPEPSEADVPRETDIFVEIHSTGADDVDNTATQVYVNSVLAYDAGVFQAGFNGSSSATSAPFTGVRRITIDPTNDFSSEELVAVRVVSQTAVVTDPLFLIDESYSFTIEDFTAPTVSSAIAIDEKTIRITFNEAMRASSSSNSDDALNPNNYTITRNNPSTTAAVNPSVVSVTALSDFEFDLTADIELTFGIPYVASVLNAEDLSGNAIAAPNNTASFVAYTPVFPADRSFDLYYMLPAMNRREDSTKDLLKFCSILQDVINVLLMDIDRWTDILDFRKASESFVDAILYGLGNPFTFDLSLADKRRLAAVLIEIYRKKGTARGIEEVVLFFLGLTIEVRPCQPTEGWVMGESELGYDTYLSTSDSTLIYSFEIESFVALTAVQRSHITSIADYMKPAHTHLKQIIEPTVPVIPDHWELGYSELGDTTLLH